MNNPETNSKLRELEQALKNLSARLARIEMKLMIQPEQLEQIPPLPRATTTPLNVDQSKEDHSGTSGSWLAYSGVLFFVLAASFLIKIAIELGWLTPVRQLSGVFILGGALIALGFKIKQQDKAYASFLPGAGIVILFMGAYAGHLYFHLYEAVYAAIFAGGLSIGSLVLFRYFRHDFFLISSVFGTYLIPMLLDRYHSDPMAVRGYFLLWDALFATCSIILGQRLLISLTAYFAICFWQLLILPIEPPNSQFLYDAITFQTLQFLILTASVALFSIKLKRPLSSKEAWAFFPVLLLFYAIQNSMLREVMSDKAAWVCLGFSAILFTIHLWAKQKLQKKTLESAPMIATFIAVSVAHSFYLEILPNSMGPWFGILMIPFLFGLKRAGLEYDRFWPVHFVIFAIIGTEYIASLGDLDRHVSASTVFVNLGFSALLLATFRFIPNVGSSSWILGLGIVQGLYGLKRVTDLYVDAPLNSFVASGLWGGAALLGLFYALKVKDALVGRACVIVLGFVALKVLLNDIASSGSIARVIALVFIGAVLYSGGLIWRKIQGWK